jgi:hypothetical protein
VQTILSVDDMEEIGKVKFEEATEKLKTAWVVFVKLLLPCCLCRKYRKMLLIEGMTDEAVTPSDEAFVLWVIDVYLERWRQTTGEMDHGREVGMTNDDDPLGECLFGAKKKRTREQVVKQERSRFNVVYDLILRRRNAMEINKSWVDGYKHKIDSVVSRVRQRESKQKNAPEEEYRYDAFKFARL